MTGGRGSCSPSLLPVFVCGIRGNPFLSLFFLPKSQSLFNYVNSSLTLRQRGSETRKEGWRERRERGTKADKSNSHVKPVTRASLTDNLTHRHTQRLPASLVLSHQPLLSSRCLSLASQPRFPGATDSGMHATPSLHTLLTVLLACVDTLSRGMPARERGGEGG